MQTFFSAFLFALFLTITASAQTLQQTPSEPPKLPKPLADTVANGAQSYYLGEYQGLYGWAIIRQGRPEYFYVTKDGSAMVMGILFDGAGEMVTAGQLAQLQANQGDDMFALTGSVDEQNTTPTSTAPSGTTSPRATTDDGGFATSLRSDYAELTPAQEMFLDVQAANWLTYGAQGEIEIFAFVDPDCPHCQRFIANAKPFVDEGLLKIRVLPIGFTAESEQKAALMLAGSNPIDRFMRYGAGDQSALNPPAGINVEAVAKNKSVMLKWNFDVTPVIVYRTGKGEIRIVRGRPKDMETLLTDIIKN